VNDKQITKQTLSKIKTNIQKTMWEKVGIIRKKKELEEALKRLKELREQLNKIKEDSGISRQLFETINLAEISILITKSALNRRKSLGAHYIKL